MLPERHSAHGCGQESLHHLHSWGVLGDHPSLIRLIEAMPRHCNAHERVRGARRAVRSRGAWQSRAVLIGPAVEFAPGRGGATDPLHCSGASRPHDEHGIGFAITQRYIMVYRVMITLVLSSRRFLVRSPRIPIRPAGQRPAASHDCAAPACPGFSGCTAPDLLVSSSTTS